MHCDDWRRFHTGQDGDLTMTKTQPETLWGRYDDEELRHETSEEAIEALIEEFDPSDNVTLIVYEYKRKELPTVEWIRDGIIQHLEDELVPEYGNPNEETNVPNEVFSAAESLARAVCEHWPVFVMERTQNKVEANVGTWKREPMS